MAVKSVLLSLALAVWATGVAASPKPSPPSPPRHHPRGWGLKKFTSLVLFGDSYTDESRLPYFIEHNFENPPVGWEQPVNDHTFSGGKVWPRFIAETTGANIYNYAVSGASCDNDITPRAFMGTLFPAIQQYEIPAYLADSKFLLPTGIKFMNTPQDETVYAIWIGTNDIGNKAFLTDSALPGKTVADYMDCIYSSLDRIYANGARNFVVMNLAPLQLSPQYALPNAGGVANDQYWPDKPSNLTEISFRMLQTVSALNDVYKYRTPYEVQIAHRYPHSNFALFDTNTLLTEIYNNPEPYLAAPANVTGFTAHCDLEGKNCDELPNPDSFLWYDELHPSEQVDRVIAREFLQVVEGSSKYAAYYSA